MSSELFVGPFLSLQRLPSTEAPGSCPGVPSPQLDAALPCVHVTCVGYGLVLSFVFIFVVLGLADFLVSCEVDKVVLQDSWDLEVDTWSRDS